MTDISQLQKDIKELENLPRDISVKMEMGQKREELAMTLKKENQNDEIWDEDVEIKPYHDIAQRKFRNDMNAYLKTIKWTDTFGLGKIKRFHIFKGSWEVGVVLKFEVEDHKWKIKTYVFKTCLWYNNEINATIIEAEAGRRRSSEGANVRRSITQWEIYLEWEKQPYIILPYLENEIDLNDLNEKDRESAYYQIWENMALMHRVKWEWFGKIREIQNDNLIGANKKFIFKEKIDGIHIKDFLIKKGFFQEKNVLENIIDHNSTVINNEFKNGEKSTLIHNDVSFANMFIENTKQWPKIIISDLDATLGHSMEDLWLAIIRNAYLNNQETQEEQKK